MANAVEFEERNDYLGKPHDMSNNQCYALPIARLVTWIPGVIDRAPAQKTLAHISCWELSPEELEEVKRTGKVYLKVIGYTTYPLSIHGKKPIYVHDGELSDHVLNKEEIDSLYNRD